MAVPIIFIGMEKIKEEALEKKDKRGERGRKGDTAIGGRHLRLLLFFSLNIRTRNPPSKDKEREEVLKGGKEKGEKGSAPMPLLFTSPSDLRDQEKEAGKKESREGKKRKRDFFLLTLQSRRKEERKT